MAEESKKDATVDKKGFGEGIEVVKDTPHEEKDIEINFNFGRILSFLKKKEKKDSSEPAAQKAEHPDLHHAAQHAKKSGAEGEEISLDIRSITSFLSKRGTTLLLVLGILVAVWMTANVRLQPAHLHFAEEWAKNSVYNTIQNDIQNAIGEQYPNLPDARKSQILADEIGKAMNSKTYVFRTGQYAGQQIDIASQVKGTAEFIKDFYRDENGRPYSPDIDPYYWYRYAKNIVETGHIGDDVRNGVEWDNHQLAPIGRQVGQQDTFFPYFLSYLYGFVKFFNSSVTLWSVQTTAYPMLVTGLTVLLVFFIGRKIAGNVGGFFSSLILGLHVAYVNRTIHGDNDATVIFFAVLTLWLFVEAIYTRNMKLRLAFAALSGLSIALFNLSWGGWWFIFLFILGAAFSAITAGILVSAIKLFRSKEPMNPVRAIKSILTERVGEMIIIPTAMFFASTGLFITLFTGAARFLTTPLLLLGVTTLKTPVLGASYWPNVLTTVAELNEGSFSEVLSQIRPGIFWVSALSVAIMATVMIINSNHARTLLRRIKASIPASDKAAYMIAFAAISTILALGAFAMYRVSIGKGFPILQSLFTPQSTTNLIFFWLSTLGAVVFAIITLACIDNVWNIIKEIPAKEEKMLYAVFFVTLIALWFLSTIYASTKGVRFVLLLTPAVGLGFGLVLGFIFKLAMWVNENFIKVSNFAVAAVIFAILATATYSTDLTKNANNIAKNDVPIINDAWYNSLSAIKEDSNSTTKDAIITSWWDFGHHFKAIADRRVTFDGTTQYGQQAHWVGKFFMTKNETEAIGILRMLDCGSNSAFEEIYNLTGDFAGSIRLLYKLIAMPSKEEARSMLQEHNLTDEQAEKVLKYTHCNPPEGYVIASEDMIGKSGVWGHFGSWDFERGAIWQAFRGKSQKEAVAAMKEDYNYSEEKAKAIYNEIKGIKNDQEANSWIAPWPSFSGDTSGCQVLVRADNTNKGTDAPLSTPDVVRCGNGLVVNLTTHDAYFPAEEGKVLHPISFVYMTNETGTEELVEKTYSNDTIPQRFSIILVPTGEWQGNSYSGYYAAVASPEQAAGMFTRMFLMEGKGLKHFKPLTHQRGMTGTNVYVYKADWESIG